MNFFSTPAHPAATVILLRDISEGFQILLLKRNSRLDFHGGHWVFPGGRLDQSDYDHALVKDDEISAARVAAVRETFEESGLKISSEKLVLMSQWTTPLGYPKRFKTWFFLSPSQEGEVVIDGHEITDFLWLSPKEALISNNQGVIHLPVPTSFSIQSLIDFSSSTNALNHFKNQKKFKYQ